jgi:pimeloyl-ACP methyl ester carboxylesterase
VPFVEVEGGRLFYDISGEGRPLVLIHGAWATHEWWRWQVPELSQHYQVYTLDVRGHGQSTPLERIYSVEGFSRDLDTFLQRFGLEQFALVGWSMGGIIAMQYCLDRPSQVKALILIATQGHRNPSFKRKILFHYVQARLSLLADFTAPRKYDRVAERFPSQGTVWLEREVEKMLSPAAPKEVFAWVMADLADNPRLNYFEVAKSIWDWEGGEELRKIKAHTLIVVGNKDSLTPPRFSRLLHAEIPNSELVIIDNCGHYVALERPDLVNREIIRFLQGAGYC